MEYKGTWSAATNTPTLANGTGDTGDVYICNAAGSVNFGAGAITFAVGDYVIYSGTIWQRSSGAVGTVTSVALTVGGDAISVSGSPLTTSGTLGLTFNGTTAQYIRGNGTLANFPTSLVTGTGTINRVTKWSFTSGEIINSGIVDIGGSIYNTLTTPGQFAWQFNGDTSTGLSYGALIVAGTNSSDIALRIENASSTSVYFYVWGDGRVQINNIPNATTDTDRFLVSDNGVIKYRTGAELLSDIGGASATGYVPYTGATTNLDLGTHTLLAAKGTFSSSGSTDTFGITHSSGSGIALNITKGGDGEGLYINKTSGSGNAATIIGTLNATTLVKSGGTSAQFLKADGSVDSTAYGTGSVTSVGLSSATSGVTIGSTPITTSGTITLAIATASGSQQGLLSSTDWTTFNNKQNALTNPVTGTGTTNYLPKFTGASTIGNSQIIDSTNVLINRTSSFTSGTLTGQKLQITGGIGINTDAADGVARLTLIGNSNTGDGTIDWGGNGNFNLVFSNNGNTRMTIDASGNLGLGVTPSASNTPTIEVGYVGNALVGRSGIVNLTLNAYRTATWKYANTGAVSNFELYNGGFDWYNAPSGTAGSDIAFSLQMRLNASGNLSIGNTNDTYKLDVTGTGRFTNSSGDTLVLSKPSGASINLQRTSATASSFAIAVDPNFNVYNYTAGTTPFSISASTGAATFSSSVQIQSSNGIKLNRSANDYYWQINSDSSNYLNFGAYLANGTAYGTNPKMILLDNGSVGIGTTSPSEKLDLQGTMNINGASGTYLQVQYNGANRGYIGTANGVISGGSTGDFGVAATSNLIFGTGGTLTERMRITSGGDICINSTSGSNGAIFNITKASGSITTITGGTTSAQNHIVFANPNGNVGSIQVSGSATSYNTSSDYRLKQDIKDFNGLDLVSKLKAYDYEWKSDKTRSYGVIAHELQSVINYAVTGVKDGKDMQGVDYSKIVPVLIKAIQEQQLQIEQLKNK